MARMKHSSTHLSNFLARVSWLLSLIGLVVVFALLLGNALRGAPAKTPEKMLSHDVFFALKDDSPEARASLIEGCREYLSDHPGTVWFAAGERVVSHDREVNDRRFEVALHLVFRDKASHDAYQNAEKHHRFIEKFQDNWKDVRVFDSWIEKSDHPE
jgi:hypothetical protein